MGRLILIMPGNLCHSNVLSDRWKEMSLQNFGLKAIAESGLPIAISYQGLDLDLCPELKLLTEGSAIEWVNSTYSHTLLPLCLHNEQIKFETKLQNNTLPVSFFSEFYAPEASFIPTEFFFVLEGASYLYSTFNSNPSEGDVSLQTLNKEDISINYDGKIGILMYEHKFKAILDAFFLFQRDPAVLLSDGRKALEHLLDRIEEVGKMPDDEIVVCPLDIEAPFVGSFFGANIYIELFEGIKRRQLEYVFAPLSSLLDTFRERAIPSKRPHRILAKWTVYEAQIKYLLSINKIKPATLREKKLYAIAGSSDIYSALERKIAGSKKPINLRARNINDCLENLAISYSQDVIDMQRAARKAIIENEKFSNLLERTHSESMLISKIIEYAKENDL